MVDELHAFIGSERGRQLQSLLHRAQALAGRRLPRVGLSATLGDMTLAAEFLRPGEAVQVELIEERSHGAELRVLVKGYLEPTVNATAVGPDDDDEPITPGQIAAHLFGVLRGSNNLVFPNSRREVERYTHLLREHCQTAGIANEFWPHHGSLSREVREDTEFALKRRESGAPAATAICTNTLELGIDIGAVKCVVQIGPAPTVASLRQRLGRSGRRAGEPAILRGYVNEEALDQHSGLASRLRLRTVRLIAQIELMLTGWCEPPAPRGLFLSTLIQQVLSLTVERGGVLAGDTLFAASKVLAKEARGPDAGSVTLRVIGLKNTPALPLLERGADLFSPELGKSEGQVKEKIIEITRTLLVRRRRAPEPGAAG